MLSESMFAEHAEKTTLGLLLVDGITAMEGCLRLQPEMFYLVSNKALFGLLRSLSSDGQDWQYSSIFAEIERRKMQSQFPNEFKSWLFSLTEGIPHRTSTTAYANQIAEAWKRRRGAELCERHGSRFEAAGTAIEELSALQASIFDVIAEDAETENPLVVHYSWAEYELFERQSHSEQLSRGLSYGNAALNDWTMGMQPGEVTVVGARSGVGKSAAMCQAIAAVCREGSAVDCFSLEMARSKVLRRLWAIESGVEYRKVHKPFLASMAERQAVKEAALRVAEWPLRIYERVDMPIDEIVARARMSVRQNGCKLVCVDYVQIVPGEGKDDRIRVSGVSQKLRTFAKSEGAHVMLLSQLRKVAHEYYSHPPTAGDLRETGQIENDAHVIVLLHRPWDSDRMMISNEASLLIPKCRDGQTGALRSEFDERSLQFR